jgi:predicted metal-dependent enzyme (double-stranded beta helix superfamily)
MTRSSLHDGRLDTVDEPIRGLLERIAPLTVGHPGDLSPAAAALADLAADLDYLRPWIERLGDTSGALGIHAPERGPRLSIVHRLEGQMSAIHDHGTWVAVSPVTGIETHRRYRRGATDDAVPALSDVTALDPTTTVTLLPPDDVHDHGHLLGAGAPAYVLILTGDDQRHYERHEWDLATGRHRVLAPGEAGRWTSDEPWP